MSCEYGSDYTNLKRTKRTSSAIYGNFSIAACIVFVKTNVEPEWYVSRDDWFVLIMKCWLIRISQDMTDFLFPQESYA